MSKVEKHYKNKSVSKARPKAINIYRNQPSKRGS